MINALLSYYWRIFFLQQMGANTESQQPDIMQRGRDLRTLGYNYESPSNPFSQGSGSTAEEADNL